ncbi:MAG TPA: hypothetical protein VFJ16_20960, partial [Longimicrobium sp.]|nr:hypothetical protein [Longimicrobium sp.]
MERIDGAAGRWSASMARIDGADRWSGSMVRRIDGAADRWSASMARIDGADRWNIVEYASELAATTARSPPSRTSTARRIDHTRRAVSIAPAAAASGASPRPCPRLFSVVWQRGTGES